MMTSGRAVRDGTFAHLLSVLACLSLLTSFGAPAALAHEGHDHGAASASPAVQAAPRVTAISENYQFVGIVEGEVLVIYLDRFADNAPVTSATLEVTIGETAAPTVLEMIPPIATTPSSASRS